MINKEDIGGICSSATNSSNIPNKTSYMDILTPKNKKTNEIYYFGTPPKKPDSLSNFLKNKGKK